MRCLGQLLVPILGAIALFAVFALASKAHADGRLPALENKAGQSLLMQAKRKCITVRGEQYCLVKGKQDSDADTCGDKSSGATEPNKAEPKERACPPGYVVLAKPNKYGAFCEPVQTCPSTPSDNASGKVEDHPCYVQCANQCSGPTEAEHKKCVISCLQTTSC